MPRCLSVVALLAALPTVVLGQQGRSTLSVGVADAQTGAPIRGAEVVLPEQKLLVRTDSMGQARVPGVPLGEHRVRVRLFGYEPSEVRLKFEGDTTGAVFRLEKSVATLGTVNVTATEVPAPLKDFETRRKQGLGKFLVESDLAKDGSRDFTLVASVRFPGLSVRTDTDGRPHIASLRTSCGGDPGRPTTDNRGVERIGGKPGIKPGLGSRGIEGEPQMSGSCESTRPCLVPVFLDNMPMGEMDTDLIRTWDLSGAEYYTPSTVPARYRTSGTACGLLLLWSKWR